MITGGTTALAPTVTPSNSSEGVTWSSSNSSVAKVENGVVTAVSEGTATITATSGTKTATCEVTVRNPQIYVVTFDYAYDNITKTVNVTEGNKVTPVETEPKRNGYKFLGWFNGETKYDFGAVVTQSLTLKAEWQEAGLVIIDQYKWKLKAADSSDKSTVAKSLNGDGGINITGSNTVENLKKAADSTDSIIFADEKIVSSSSEATGNAINDYYIKFGKLTFDVKHEFSLKASFTTNKNNIKVSLNDSTDSSVKKELTASTLHVVNCLDTGEAYLPAGSYTLEASGDAYLYELLITTVDQTPFKVTYNNVDGNGKQEFEWFSDEVDAELKTPQVDGKTFDGWYTDEACTELFSATRITKPTTLYAKWTVASYATEVTINNGESEVIVEPNVVNTLTTQLVGETNQIYTYAWTSSNENVINVDEKGNLTCVSAGYSKIEVKATSEDGTQILTASIVAKALKDKIVDVASKKYTLDFAEASKKYFGTPVDSNKVEKSGQSFNRVAVNEDGTIDHTNINQDIKDVNLDINQGGMFSISEYGNEYKWNKEDSSCIANSLELTGKIRFTASKAGKLSISFGVNKSHETRFVNVVDVDNNNALVGEGKLSASGITETKVINIAKAGTYEIQIEDKIWCTKIEFATNEESHMSEDLMKAGYQEGTLNGKKAIRFLGFINKDIVEQTDYVAFDISIVGSDASNDYDSLLTDIAKDNKVYAGINYLSSNGNEAFTLEGYYLYAYTLTGIPEDFAGTIKVEAKAMNGEKVIMSKTLIVNLPTK